MLLDRWVEHPDLGTAEFALSREAPVRQRGAVQVRGLAQREILGIDLAVIAANELVDGRAIRGRDLCLDERQNLLQPLVSSADVATTIKFSSLGRLSARPALELDAVAAAKQDTRCRVSCP
jgi:hypothetical protein